MKHLHDAFSDVKSFLEDEDLPSSQLKLLQILNNSLKNRKLQTDLAVTVDACKQFIKAIHNIDWKGWTTSILIACIKI